MQHNAQAMTVRDLNESGSRWSDVGLRKRLQKRMATTKYVPNGQGGEESRQESHQESRQECAPEEEE